MKTTQIIINGKLGDYLSLTKMYPEEKRDRVIHPLVDGKIPERVGEEVLVFFRIEDRSVDEFKVGLKFSLGYSPVFVSASGEDPAEIQEILDHGSERVYIDNDGVLHFHFGEVLKGDKAAEARANLIDVLIRGILRGAKARFTKRTYLKPHKRYSDNQLFALGYFTSYLIYTRDSAELADYTKTRYSYLRFYFNKLRLNAK